MSSERPKAKEHKIAARILENEAKDALTQAKSLELTIRSIESSLAGTPLLVEGSASTPQHNSHLEHVINKHLSAEHGLVATVTQIEQRGEDALHDIKFQDVDGEAGSEQIKLPKVKGVLAERYKLLRRKGAVKMLASEAIDAALGHETLAVDISTLPKQGDKPRDMNGIVESVEQTINRQTFKHDIAIGLSTEQRQLPSRSRPFVAFLPQILKSRPNLMTDLDN